MRRKVVNCALALLLIFSVASVVVGVLDDLGIHP